MEICSKSIVFHSSFRRFFLGETELFSCIVFTQARIRKGETGLVIFAGDVTPIEVCIDGLWWDLGFSFSNAVH